jgi:hypothetical protein
MPRAPALPPNPPAATPSAGGGSWLSAPKVQGGCGSCAAFAAVAAAEAAVASQLRHPGPNLLDFSEQSVFHCNEPSGSCTWGWEIPSAADVVSKYGVVPEACLPYQDQLDDAAVPACRRRAAADCGGVPAGAFRPRELLGDAAAKAHIMRYGSVGHPLCPLAPVPPCPCAPYAPYAPCAPLPLCPLAPIPLPLCPLAPAPGPARALTSACLHPTPHTPAAHPTHPCGRNAMARRGSTVRCRGAGLSSPPSASRTTCGATGTLGAPPCTSRGPPPRTWAGTP